MTSLLTTALLLATLVLAAALVRARRRTAELHRRLEEERLQAQCAEDGRRRLLSALSHDLRSPLSIIIGYQELLADGIFGDVPERGRDALGRIARAARELLYLIDAVVDVSRLESGEERLHAAACDPGDILQQLAARPRPEGSERPSACQLHVDGELGRIEADPDRLRLLVRLTLDAIAHAAGGKPIRIRARPADGSGFILDIPDCPLEPYRPDDTTRRGLRIDLATRLARLLGAELVFVPDGPSTALRIHIPSANRIDAIVAVT